MQHPPECYRTTVYRVTHGFSSRPARGSVDPAGRVGFGILGSVGARHPPKTPRGDPARETPAAHWTKTGPTVVDTGSQAWQSTGTMETIAMTPPRARGSFVEDTECLELSPIRGVIEPESVLDTSRATVNTHHSILNFDDEDDDSVDDEPPKTPPRPCCHAIAPHPSSEVSLPQPTLLDVVQNGFQSLCFVDSPLSLAGQDIAPQRALEYDILQLLGCFYADDDAPRLWSDCLRTTPPPAVEQSPQRCQKISRPERARRIHQMALATQLPTRSTTVVSPHSVLFPPRTRSLGPLPNLPMTHHKNSNAKFPTDGYDSDPEIRLVAPEEFRTPQTIPFKPNITQGTISEVVQESFNMTWTLTLDGRPVTVWLERGSMIHNQTLLLEPSLCWRPVHAPLTCQPTCLRLLQVARLLTTGASSEHRWTRPSCCLLVKTTITPSEFCFQARTMEERDDTARRWKACIARFASLAVLEDLDRILQEFVHAPTDILMRPAEQNNAAHLIL